MQLQQLIDIFLATAAAFNKSKILFCEIYRLLKSTFLENHIFLLLIKINFTFTLSTIPCTISTSSLMKLSTCLKCTNKAKYLLKEMWKSLEASNPNPVIFPRIYFVFLILELLNALIEFNMKILLKLSNLFAVQSRSENKKVSKESTCRCKMI